MAELKNFDSSVLEGNVKYRDKKAWKRRWCVIRRLSPVANSLIVQLHKKPSNKVKASLNLEHLVGVDSCFLLHKESQTLAIMCKSSTVILAFDTREMLLEWQAQITDILGQCERYEVQLLSVPSKMDISSGSAVLHIRDWQFALSQGIPPRLLGYWNLADLRRFGAVDDRRFCFEGGSRCSARGYEGLFVLGSSRSQEIASRFEYAVRGRLSDALRSRHHHPSSTISGLLTPTTRQRFSVSRCLSMSKPNTPLLGRQRRAPEELCLSPPCARHMRSASQQHSRASSVSSGTRRNSALQHSDPELLYDKPRSLNAAMSQAAHYEPVSRPPSAQPQASHYDTPRRLLHSLNHDTLDVPRAISSLYATVTKPKNKAKKRLELDSKGEHGLATAAPSWCSHENRLEQQYQNALWLRLQAEGAAATYQNPMNLRCLYPGACCPLDGNERIHNDNVPLRLRRSASMPACRQGNRDSSDSTDSGVSVADSFNHQTSTGPSNCPANNGCGHHLYHHTRHWSLPRSQGHQPMAGAGAGAVSARRHFTVLAAATAMATTTLATDTVTTGDTGCHSNSSSISNILDQLETQSVASVGYETSV